MPLLVKARSFLRNLFLTRRVELDLDAEVHSHLAMLAEGNLRDGMRPEEAQRAARIELGGIDQVKEQVREKRIGNWLQSVIFRLPLWRSTTPQKPGLHLYRCSHARSWHRREHGYFQRGLGGDALAVALS